VPAFGELDAHLFRLVYDGATAPVWGPLMTALSFLGSGWSLLAIVPFLGWARAKSAARSFLVTVVATAAAVFVLKLAFGRARPCVALEGVVARCAPPHDFSFPSGHSAGSFCFAAFFATLLLASQRGSPAARRSAAFALVLFAIGVALSRVYLGVHFPFDVAIGALLGASLGTFGARQHLQRVNS
jgi:undecaprenyl-diphosphatase